MIALLVLTDGRRDCIEETIPSAFDNLRGPVTRRVLYDDSGDEGYRSWLLKRFPTFELVHHPHGRQGFGGAIQTAWRHLALVREPYVFHLEDDFTFNRPVDLQAMMQVLDSRPYLVQLALRRQPWNDQEKRAGGIVEMHPNDYTEHALGGHHWLEHRRNFTTNPSLYRRSLCARGWPEGRETEGRFGIGLMEDDPDLRFAYWGSRDSGEWVTHIGDQRVGMGY